MRNFARGPPVVAKAFPISETEAERRARNAIDVLFDRLGYTGHYTSSDDTGHWYSTWGGDGSEGPELFVD